MNKWEYLFNGILLPDEARLQLNLMMGNWQREGDPPVNDFGLGFPERIETVLSSRENSRTICRDAIRFRCNKGANCSNRHLTIRETLRVIHESSSVDSQGKANSGFAFAADEHGVCTYFRRGREGRGQRCSRSTYMNECQETSVPFDQVSCRRTCCYLHVDVREHMMEHPSFWACANGNNVFQETVTEDSLRVRGPVRLDLVPPFGVTNCRQQ